MEKERLIDKSTLPRLIVRRSNTQLINELRLGKGN